MASIPSAHVKRLGALLRSGAEDQAEEARAKLEAAKGLYEALLSDLIASEFGFERAYETALEFFGSPKVRFAAVDGSQDQRLVSGLAIFWGGAYAATGEVRFRPDGPPKIDYHTGFIERGKGVSSCVPVYIDRVHELDQALMRPSGPGQLTISNQMTEQATIDNSSIAGWVMTFSEIYLAYKMVAEEGARIILLDRSLSGTWSNLIRDTMRGSRWKTDGAIHGFEIDGIPIDANEMGYGRHRALNLALRTPPARGDYLRYALMYHLERAGRAMGLEDICAGLGLVEEGRRERALKLLDRSAGEGYLAKAGDRYSLKPRYFGSWDRLKGLVLKVGGRLFESEKDNPMRVESGGERKWITTQDLAFLSLYCLLMLLEECWAKKALLMGVTKDTTAGDFKAHLIPLCIEEGIWKADPESFGDLPGTDRMLLQAVSALNWEGIEVPWALIEYDSAFQTIVPSREKRGYVSGARKNKIISERLFLKSYIQLEESKGDPGFRSNVLLIDRLAHPEYDLKALVSFKQEYDGAVEPVEPILYGSRRVPNELQNLAMVALKAMSSKGIPEAFGHNKPLFIADKVAKAQRESVEGLVEAVGHWLMVNPRLRRFSFYMHTFRERRGEVERTRMGREA
jgi:hypothetical protein